MGLLAAIVELIDDLIADVTRIGRHVWQSPVPYLGFGFGAIIVTWLLLGRSDGGDFLSVAFWSKDPEGMRNLLWSLATVAAGAAGLYGLSLAARRTKALDEQARIAEENRQLSEQAQITDRFTRAVEQLGHDEIAVRLGAIYALERIALDSPRDFETVMQTLAAFVRMRSPWPAKYNALSDMNTMMSAIGEFFRTGTIRSLVEAQVQKDAPIQRLEGDEKLQVQLSDEQATQSNKNASDPVEEDVSACLMVLARTIPDRHALRSRRVGQAVSLRNVNFRGLQASGINASGFDLAACNFSGADISLGNFRDCQMTECIFDGVEAESVIFTDASVRNARFEGANLIGGQFDRSLAHDVDFSMADLTATNFDDAFVLRSRFDGSTVTGASFVGTAFSNGAQLVDAWCHSKRVPRGLKVGFEHPKRNDEELD